MLDLYAALNYGRTTETADSAQTEQMDRMHKTGRIQSRLRQVDRMHKTGRMQSRLRQVTRMQNRIRRPDRAQHLLPPKQL